MSQPLKVFGHIPFLEACVDAIQAQWNARIADQVLDSQSFVMYGRFINGKYLDFSTDKKPGDTHCILCYAAKQMFMPIENYDKLHHGA